MQVQAHNNPSRRARNVSEHDIAIALLLQLADSGLLRFSLLGFYDEDADFLNDLAQRLGLARDQAFQNKLTRVVRRLVGAGVLSGQMCATHRAYLGEPAKQMEYGFPKPSHARRLSACGDDHVRTPEAEAALLMRRAYPALKEQPQSVEVRPICEQERSDP